MCTYLKVTAPHTSSEVPGHSELIFEGICLSNVKRSKYFIGPDFQRSSVLNLI